MIELRDIEFKYPKKKAFSLKELSLVVKPGEIFTLLGPNGAGKTTLIRILSGLIIPRRGSVTICGHDMQRTQHEARSRIGLVLGDERTFYFRLSGAQNLEFFGGLYGIKRAALKRRVPEVLNLVGLSGDAKLQFMRFSSGMRKRLNLARALLHEPQVLLLDEPTSSVDPESAQKMRQIIFELKGRGRTILLTTHDMNEAERMSDRIGFLKEGRLIKIGTLADFRSVIVKRRLVVQFDPGKPLSRSSIRRISTDIRKVTTLDSIDFEDNRLTIGFNGSFDMNRVLATVSSDETPIHATNTHDASLEDVFITLAR